MSLQGKINTNTGWLPKAHKLKASLGKKVPHQCIREAVAFGRPWLSLAVWIRAPAGYVQVKK